MMRILAFEAHPDDIEHFCSGTLAKYRSTGHEVGIVCMTNGEVGHPKYENAEIARIREGEARAAASLVRAQFYWMGYPDEFLFNSREIRLKTIEVVRDFDPDIMITLDKDHDYHPDHCTAGQIVWDIHVMTTVPNIKTGNKITRVIPEIYFCDTSAGINFQPELYVNIDAFWETKAAMLACHASQETWCMNQYNVSLIENSRVQSRFRGYQAGCTYAEAFRRPRFFPQHVSTNELLG
jgi:LmbE family N-acetylglucosaminyl deacetylase